MSRQKAASEAVLITVAIGIIAVVGKMVYEWFTAKPQPVATEQTPEPQPDTTEYPKMTINCTENGTLQVSVHVPKEELKAKWNSDGRPVEIKLEDLQYQFIQQDILPYVHTLIMSSQAPAEDREEALVSGVASPGVAQKLD